MARQAPRFEFDSEEEPMEDTHDSMAASAHGSPSVHDRESSVSSEVQAAPPVVPTPTTTTTGTRPQFAETSGGRMLRMTPRIVIRDFPRGPLAPRDKAPMTGPTTLAEEPSLSRLPHLDWMPRLLREWRALEGIPSTYETGEPSHASSVPHTREPLELTVPTLVAVIRTLFRLSSSRGADLRELMSDISRLDGDMMSTYQRFDFLEGNMFIARETAEYTRARLRMWERRARLTGIIIGILTMLAALMAAVCMYLPLYR